MLPASFGNAFANFRAELIEPHRRVTHLAKKKQPLLCPVPSRLNTQKMAADTESESGGSSPGAITPKPFNGVYLNLGTLAFSF